MVEQYTRKPNTVCIVCGSPTYKRPAVLQSNNGRSYCSMSCYGRSCRKENPCVVCQKPILASKNKKTCSRSCANKHRAGLTYISEERRDKVISSQALKARLMKARGKACERCGYNKHEILNIHHKNRDRKNNDLSNLELICPNCHMEEHYLKSK